MKKKVVVDTCVLFNYSDYLKNNNYQEFSDIDLFGMDFKLSQQINTFAFKINYVFENKLIKNLDFNKNSNLHNYYNVNKMCYKILTNQNTKLNYDSKLLILSLLKKNYKEFLKNYETLIPDNNNVNSLKKRISVVTKSFTDNMYNSAFKKIIDNFTKISTIRMFNYARNNPDKIELLITNNLETEIYTHISDSYEFKTALVGHNIDEIRLFDEVAVLKVLKNVSLVKFDEKLYNEARVLGENFLKIYDSKKGKLYEPFSRKKDKNLFGDMGDSLCYAGGKLLGKVYVTSNLEDMRGKGLNFNVGKLNELSTKFLSCPITDSVISTAIFEIKEQISTKKDNNVNAYIEKFYGKGKNSNIVSPNGFVDKVENFITNKEFDNILQKEIAKNPNKSPKYIEQILKEKYLIEIEEPLLNIDLIKQKSNISVKNNEYREYNAVYNTVTYNKTTPAVENEKTK